MTVIDVVYHAHNNFATTCQVLEKHAPSYGYVPYIKDRVSIELIKHFKKESTELVNDIPVKFFKRWNRSWCVPFRTHRYIRSVNPDVVIIQGFIFPAQLIFLKLALRGKCKIIVQHHGEKPYKGYKRWVQMLADKCITAYLFTSKGNNREWIEKKVIADESKCFEIQSGSTLIVKKNKEESRKLLHVKEGLVFIWVGRLNENKDPITVLQAFKKYLTVNENVHLYMIYHTAEILSSLKYIMDSDNLLKKAIILVGEVDHNKLGIWYSAADFYISASHQEACGYALLEAMSCGCIPIVTDIPSFRKMTDNGAIGFLYPPGDVDYLFSILKHLQLTELKELSGRTQKHFNEKLSFKNIADDIFDLCQTLGRK